MLYCLVLFSVGGVSGVQVGELVSADVQLALGLAGQPPRRHATHASSHITSALAGPFAAAAAVTAASKSAAGTGCVVCSR